MDGRSGVLLGQPTAALPPILLPSPLRVPDAPPPASHTLPPPPPPARLPGTRAAWPKPAERPPLGGLLSAIASLAGAGDLCFAPMPAHLSEPGTHLTKQADELENCGLLAHAAAAPEGSVERFALVAAYAFAWYGNGVRRWDKPVNPRLGETLDVDAVCGATGQRVRAVFEAVHQSAAAAEYRHAWAAAGPGWVTAACDNPVARIAGGGMEVADGMRLEVVFDGAADGPYRAQRAALRIAVLSTPPVFTLVPPFAVEGGGWALKVDAFGQPGGWGGGPPAERNRLDAPVLSSLTGAPPPGAPRIVGTPVLGLDLAWGDGRPPSPLWRPAPLPRGARGGATPFAAGVGHLVPHLHATLPPTDSRHRPDVAAIAAGEWKRAAALARAEDARARAVVRALDAGAAPRPRPAWFVDLGKGEFVRYRYAGGYWEARDAAAAEE